MNEIKVTDGVKHASLLPQKILIVKSFIAPTPELGLCRSNRKSVKLILLLQWNNTLYKM
jgi:hypothetical protein